MKHATASTFPPLASRPPPSLLEVANLLCVDDLLTESIPDFHSHWGPCQFLMLAVLQDAIKIYQDGAFFPFSPRHQKDAAAEALWFDNRDGHETMSFVHICEVLDFDADYLRAGLLKWGTYQPLGSAQHSRRRSYSKRAARLQAA